MNVSVWHICLVLLILCIPFVPGRAEEREMSVPEPMYSSAPENAPPVQYADFAKKFSGFEFYDPPRALLPSLEIVSVDGKVGRLDDLKGKWRLINFWGLWCHACLVEIPTLLRLQQEKNRADFEVVFVFVEAPDAKTAEPAAMQKRIAEAGLPEDLYFYYSKDPDFWGKLALPGIPVNIVLTPEGLVRYRIMGEADWMEKESLAFVDDFLKN